MQTNTVAHATRYESSRTAKKKFLYILSFPKNVWQYTWTTPLRRKKTFSRKKKKKTQFFLLSIEILLCKIVIRHNQSLALELINLKQGLIHLLLVFVISFYYSIWYWTLQMTIYCLSIYFCLLLADLNSFQFSFW